MVLILFVLLEAETRIMADRRSRVTTLGAIDAFFGG